MILAFFSTEFKSIKWPFDWQQQTSRGRNLSQGLFDLLLISSSLKYYVKPKKKTKITILKTMNNITFEMQEFYNSI